MVKVHRGICKCGKTEALLPDVLIPFSSYSLRFVLKILWKFLHRKETVEKFCAKYCIAVQTVYNWLSLFKLHYNKWMDITNELAGISRVMIRTIMDIPTFPLLFYKKAGFSFFQGNRYAHNCRIDFSPP